MKSDPRPISARMLHLNFQMLVDFVEVDCAEQRQIYTRQKRPAVGGTEGRSAEDGMAHLDSLIRCDWQEDRAASSEQDFGDAYLFQETFIADGGYVSLTGAAWSHAARELKELYLWYTGRRRAASSQEVSDEEDQAMLIRLMKIRLYLWM